MSVYWWDSTEKMFFTKLVFVQTAQSIKSTWKNTIIIYVIMLILAFAVLKLNEIKDKHKVIYMYQI